MHLRTPAKGSVRLPRPVALLPVLVADMWVQRQPQIACHLLLMSEVAGVVVTRAKET